MAVTGHDYIGLSLNRALQNAVVVWIVADHVEGEVRGDQFSYPDQPLRSTNDAAFLPLKILSEDARGFMDNGGRNKKPIVAPLDSPPQRGHKPARARER
jgi:hypothetical protein